LGRPITPLGPVWLDKLMSAILQLKGDCVSDFRLIDYLVALLGTNESPALDGSLGNENRLKGDLAQLGIFSESMSLYLLYKLRCYAAIGFSGFEGRHYSLFESFGSDMADAASLQALVTALAFKYISDGTVRHADIPDDPEAESERRQMIFGTAIGISACNVREDTPNAFLQNILTRTQKTRASRRYAGCLRVRLNDYHQALVATIEQDAASLIEEFGLHETIMHLKERLLDPEHCGVAGKITSGIVSEAGVRSPMRLSGDEFNRAAERYYRDTLRVRQLSEALDILEDDLKQIDSTESRADQYDREMVTAVIGAGSGPEFLREVKHNLLNESADTPTLARCIALALVTISRDASTARAARETPITSV
jgi:hypothetical protein